MNFSELNQVYNVSKQYEISIVDIFVFRKLLDAHLEVNGTRYQWDSDFHLDPMSFDRRIAQNQVSNGSLVYLWNCWKVHSCEIIKCLSNLQRTDVSN